MALGKTAEILRGLGGALGWSCPSDPRRVTPPPAGGGRFLSYIRTYDASPSETTSTDSRLEVVLAPV